jgi:nucleoside-diphosphate-sugar epimerase
MTLVGLDTGYYRDGWLYSDNRHQPATPHTLNKDLRAATAADLADCTAVVHLAELSNDPLGENNPEVTHQINHRGSVALAQQAVAAGIERFVYTSSCSVYGAGTGEFWTRFPRRPQTATRAARCSWARSARHGRSRFTPVLLRNATAFVPRRACASILSSTTCAHSPGSLGRWR